MPPCCMQGMLPMLKIKICALKCELLSLHNGVGISAGFFFSQKVADTPNNDGGGRGGGGKSGFTIAG
jgi:hypothetical protein